MKSIQPFPRETEHLLPWLTALVFGLVLFTHAARSADAFETIHVFQGPEGEGPFGGLILGRDGLLYGTTQNGGDRGGNVGTAYRLSYEGVHTVLHAFSGGGDGAYPAGGLSQAPDGTFYGTTLNGGTYGYGTAFNFGQAGSFRTLLHFDGPKSGLGNVDGNLVFAADGNAYGASHAGNGAIFRLTVGGTLSILYQFKGQSDGQGPRRLAMGRDGQLYGTTLSGGTAGVGTLFRVTLKGQLTTLHHFSGGADGGWPSPYGSLAIAADGTVFGATAGTGSTGAAPYGTIFRWRAGSGLSTLYRFTGGPDGATPSTGVILGRDGQLYGVCLYGGGRFGQDGLGTAFRVSTAGQFAVLHTFQGGRDAASPDSPLVQGIDGNLYGTTQYGENGLGEDGNGIIFRIVLADVRPPNGPPTISPVGDIAMAANGQSQALAFTIADAETSASALVVSVSSSDPALFPANGLRLAGSGAARNLTLIPARGRTGNAQITVTVADGVHTTSSTFVAMVLDPPTVVTLPKDRTVAKGGDAEFVVEVAGAPPFAFQWKRGTTPLADGNGIAGVRTARLVVAGVTAASAGTYSVVVSNQVGSVASIPVRLSVQDPPMVTIPPSQQTVPAGATATFRVVATGTAPLGYQWIREGTNLVAGGAYAGVNGPTLTVSRVQAAHAGTFAVWVTNAVGRVLSQLARLELILPPSITSQPVGGSVSQGSTVTLSVTASGAAPLGFQWRRGSVALTDGPTVQGARTATLTLPGIQPTANGTYTVVVTNRAGSITSAGAVLTVVQPPVITQQPENRVLTEGDELLLTVGATGNPVLRYAWSRDGTALPTQTNALLRIAKTSPSDAGLYRVEVFGNGVSARSREARVEVQAIPVVVGAARWLGLDRVTGGEWPTKYGGLNRLLAPDPAGGSAGAGLHVWEEASADPRSMVLSDAPGAARRAACWWSATSLHWRVEVPTNEIRRVSFYLVDWERAGRAVRITATPLDRGSPVAAEIRDFGAGVYATWEVRGPAEFEVRNLIPALNAVVSAVLVDGPIPFRGVDSRTAGEWPGRFGQAGAWFPITTGPSPLLAGQTYIWSGVTTEQRAPWAPDGSARWAACWWAADSVRFRVNLSASETRDLSLYFLDWDHAGRAQRVRVRTLADGSEDVREVRDFAGGKYLRWTVRGPVEVEVEPLPGSPNAVVSGLLLDGPVAGLGSDSNSAGLGAGYYGADRAWLAPEAAGLAVEAGHPYVWAVDSADSRVPSLAAGVAGVAACWWSATTMRFALDLPEEPERELTLYCVDWERAGRAQRVTVTPQGGAGPRSTRELRNFGGGTYLRWRVRGPVDVEIENLPGSPNAVLSGVLLR